MSSDRNREIVISVLNGKSFSEIATELGISSTSVRSGFIREIRQSIPQELWEQGKAAGVSGAYATPSLKWLRENKAIAALINKGPNKKEPDMERIKLHDEDIDIKSEALIKAVKQQVEESINELLDQFLTNAFFTIEDKNPGEIRLYVGDDHEKYASNTLAFLEIQLLDTNPETREKWAAEFERIAKSIREHK